MAAAVAAAVVECQVARGSTAAPETYRVPWKVRTPKDKPAKGLVVYWFPASNEEVKRSSLRESRSLSLYASQCISMELADAQVPNAQQLVGEAKLPVAVIANPDGTPVTRVENKDGKLKVEALEKVLATEVKDARDRARCTTEGSKGKSRSRRKRSGNQTVSGSCRTEVHVPRQGEERCQRTEEAGR